MVRSRSMGKRNASRVTEMLEKIFLNSVRARYLKAVIALLLGLNAAQLAKSFDGSFSGSQSFRDAMDETARTQQHIYVGSSLEDLRNQPGFDRAGFHPNSREVLDTNAFGKPSGAGLPCGQH